MDGYYEHSRDVEKTPSCWRSVNNTCFPHFHSCVEITYVTEGSLDYVLNGHGGTARAGQVIVAPSYTVHYFNTPQSSGSIVLTVPLDYVPSFRKLIARRTFCRLIWDDPDPQSELLHSLEKLTELCTMKGGNPPELRTKGYLYTVLGILTDCLGLTENEEGTDAFLARDILQYLDQHYRFDVTLETLAARFGYSKSRFSHLFHAYFGCGIPEYINTLRCRSAALLLTQESASLTSAAMNSGFESMRTFYRSFKKSFGISPSEYLREKRGREPDDMLHNPFYLSGGVLSRREPGSGETTGEEMSE